MVAAIGQLLIVAVLKKGIRPSSNGRLQRSMGGHPEKDDMPKSPFLSSLWWVEMVERYVKL